MSARNYPEYILIVANFNPDTGMYDNNMVQYRKEDKNIAEVELRNRLARNINCILMRLSPKQGRAIAKKGT
jgi:hypothetical protein